MNAVSRTLIIFLSGFCIFVPANCKPAIADSTVLKGGAEDAEKMQKSIKLMVPDATPPRPIQQMAPAQVQTGVSRTDLLQQSARFQAFQEQAAANRAAAMLRQQAEAQHQAMIQRHFGVETETTPVFRSPYITPRRVAPGSVYQPRLNNVYRPSENTQVQVDPWTSVSAVPYRQKSLAALQASIKQLRATPNTVASAPLQSVPEQPAQPLKAVEMMLPMAPPPKDWDAWYKKVAAAIYDRWKQNTAGPGTSVVLITVYDSRDVDCRVTDFKEAEGAAANGAEETRFKQISLQCVDGLSGDEVWQFPAIKPLPKKIVFDMEFKHVVGEDAGCRIVHLHNELPESTQK